MWPLYVNFIFLYALCWLRDRRRHRYCFCLWPTLVKCVIDVCFHFAIFDACTKRPSMERAICWNLHRKINKKISASCSWCHNGFVRVPFMVFRARWCATHSHSHSIVYETKKKARFTHTSYAYAFVKLECAREEPNVEQENGKLRRFCSHRVSVRRSAQLVCFVTCLAHFMRTQLFNAHSLSSILLIVNAPVSKINEISLNRAWSVREHFVISVSFHNSAQAKLIAGKWASSAIVRLVAIHDFV